MVKQTNWQQMRYTVHYGYGLSTVVTGSSAREAMVNELTLAGDDTVWAEPVCPVPTTKRG